MLKEWPRPGGIACPAQLMGGEGHIYPDGARAAWHVIVIRWVLGVPGVLISAFLRAGIGRRGGGISMRPTIVPIRKGRPEFQPALAVVVWAGLSRRS